MCFTVKWMGGGAIAKGFVALGACCALFGGAAPATAHQVTIPATVAITGDAEQDADARSLSGYLATARSCAAERSITVLARYGEWTDRHVWGLGDWKVVAEMRTNSTGAFGVSIPSQDLEIARIRVSRDIVKRPGHRHFCAGALADRAY
jgi:hypothetical protein